MAKYICLSACLSVCLSVSLSITKVYCPWPSDLYKIRHCLGLNITFSDRDVPSQNNPNWSTQRKYVVVTLDRPGNSGSECVCPVFQAL